MLDEYFVDLLILMGLLRFSDVENLRASCSTFLEKVFPVRDAVIAVSCPETPETNIMFRVLRLVATFGCKILLNMEQCHDMIDQNNILRVLRYIDQLRGKLVALDLAGCRLCVEPGVIAETAGVIASSTALKWLSINDSMVVPASDAMLHVLGDALRRCVTLTHLDMGFCNLSGRKVNMCLGWGVSNVQRLDLSYNSITPSGMKRVVKCLIIMQGVQELNLEGNRIGPMGVRTMLAALPQLRALRVLNLRECIHVSTVQRWRPTMDPLLEEALERGCVVTLWWPSDGVVPHEAWRGNTFDRGHHPLDR